MKGGTPPFDYNSNELRLATLRSELRSQQASVRPDQSQTYTIDVRDALGQHQHHTAVVSVRQASGAVQPALPPDQLRSKPAATPVGEVTAEGPLAQALGDLWEKARQAKFPNVARLTVKLFDATAAWKVHSAMATVPATEGTVQCHFSVGLEAAGVETFQLDFVGGVEKANPVRAFLDTQVRLADTCDLKVTYALTFAAPLSLADDRAEQLAKRLTQYGAGAAFVEAQAGRAAAA